MVQDGDNMILLSNNNNKKKKHIKTSPQTSNRPPKPLKQKKELRWGGPTHFSVREITKYVSKGREADIHPGDNSIVHKHVHVRSDQRSI